MSSKRLTCNRSWRRPAVALILGVSLVAGCDTILEVDTRSDLTDSALSDPASAIDHVNSFIAHFECGYSTWSYYSAGDEDGMDPRSGLYWAGGSHRYNHYPNRGGCDENAHDTSYYDQFMVSRAMAYFLHDRLNAADGWTVQQVPEKEKLSAFASLYAAANLEYLGSYFCEMSIDRGELMTVDETLGLASGWVDAAFQHIAAVGSDFELPHDITPFEGGATAMAYALQARIRWAQGDLQGAAQAASQVPIGFKAHVTRSGGLQRRNKVYQQGLQTPYSRISGVNDWWQGQPNPVTGQDWPEVIPFTGSLHLAILPDGRAVWDDNQLPVRTEGPHRKAGENAAVPDTRVPTELNEQILGGGTGYVPVKYASESDPIPFLNWEEIWLIRAEAEGGQAAIDLVNDIRDAHGLPRVTYADPSDPVQIRNMIIEEKRRSLWLEGRYLATKIKNTDILWFPRGNGVTQSLQADYLGAVRRLMPEDEYILNPNFTLDAQATGCNPNEAPVRF
jgi:hypothetical protein